MNPREFLAKRKIHLFFGGAFVCVLAFNVISGFEPGESVLSAAWRALSEVRPMDYLLFVLFWYACAVRRPEDDWHTPLVALNLSRTNSEK